MDSSSSYSYQDNDNDFFASSSPSAASSAAPTQPTISMTDGFTFRDFSEFGFEEFSNASLSNSLSDGFQFAEMSEMTMSSAFDQVDFDPKFRSIQAADSHAFSSFGPPLFSKYEPQSQSQFVQGPPQLKKDSFQVPLVEISPSTKTSYQIAIEPSTFIVVPEKPFFLGPAQFITTLCLVDLVSRINQKLDEYFEVSYNFFPDQCRWEIVYLRGSSRSKFEVNVYKENSSSFLVEGNRLSGDSSSFHNVYCEIQSSLTNSKKAKKKSYFRVFSASSYRTTLSGRCNLSNKTNPFDGNC